MVNKKWLTAFGNTLRDERQKAGLTQELLAEKSGLHRTYIGSVERGERNPTLLSIARIAGALHLPPSSLLRGVDRQVRS
jgi:transcriptional regulator with XRE-family HTH domain